MRQVRPSLITVARSPWYSWREMSAPPSVIEAWKIPRAPFSQRSAALAIVSTRGSTLWNRLEVMAETSAGRSHR